MNFENLIKRAEENRAIAFDLVRVYLGLALFSRGVVFIADPGAFYGLLNMADPAFSAMVLGHYVALAHLAGGLLLTAGLFTRIAAAVQLPILLGALLFVHLGQGLLADGQGLELSALVLALLAAFTVYGSGQLSLDHLLFRKKSVAEEEVELNELHDRRRSELRRREADRAPVTALNPAGEREKACEHGRSREHPRVVVEREYGLGRSLRFVMGTTAEPRQITFRCADCAGVVEVSRHPEDLSYYRYRDEKPPADVATDVHA